MLSAACSDCFLRNRQRRTTGRQQSAHVSQFGPLPPIAVLERYALRLNAAMTRFSISASRCASLWWAGSTDVGLLLLAPPWPPALLPPPKFRNGAPVRITPRMSLSSPNTTRRLIHGDVRAIVSSLAARLCRPRAPPRIVAGGRGDRGPPPSATSLRRCTVDAGALASVPGTRRSCLLRNSPAIASTSVGAASSSRSSLVSPSPTGPSPPSPRLPVLNLLLQSETVSERLAHRPTEPLSH